MPRLILDDPWCRGAIWTRQLGLAGATVALAAIILSHHATIGPRHALAVLAIGLALAVLTLPVGIAAMLAIWRDGSKGIGRVVVGFGLAALTLGYPGFLAIGALRHPPASEITTAVDDPPRFSRSTRAYAARGDTGFGPVAGWLGARRVAEASPVLVDDDADEAFSNVVQTLKALRVRVIEAVPPGGRAGLGHIDAVTYSAIMHLPEDVAIRIRPGAGQTRIDLRATSRLGLPDFGNGAKTIDAIADALRDQGDGV